MKFLVVCLSVICLALSLGGVFLAIYFNDIRWIGLHVMAVVLACIDGWLMFRAWE